MGILFFKKKTNELKELKELVNEIKDSLRELSNLNNMSKINYGTPAPIVGTAEKNYKILQRAIPRIDLLKLKLKKKEKLTEGLENYLNELKKILIVNIQLLNKYFETHINNLNNKVNLRENTEEIEKNSNIISENIKKIDFSILDKIDEEISRIEKAA